MGQALFSRAEFDAPTYEHVLDWCFCHPDYVEGISEQVFLLELEAEGEVYFCVADCLPAMRERYKLAHDYFYNRAIEEILADPPDEALA